jgi:hypothetical protein
MHGGKDSRMLAHAEIVEHQTDTSRVPDGE